MLDFDDWYMEVYELLPDEDRSPNDDLIGMYHDYLFDMADNACTGL